MSIIDESIAMVVYDDMILFKMYLLEIENEKEWIADKYVIKIRFRKT